jgi:hypothetical protein
MIRNPFCPTPLAPKKMLQGGFGDFYFCEMLLLRMALTTSKDVAEMTRVVKAARGSKTLVALPLRADTHRNAEDLKKRWMARKRDFPPIPSLLLPPNNKETLKPKAFASSCLNPSS